MICSICYHLSSNCEEKGNTGYSRWESGTCILGNLFVFPLIVSEGQWGSYCLVYYVFCTNEHIQVILVNIL